MVLKLESIEEENCLHLERYKGIIDGVTILRCVKCSHILLKELLAAIVQYLVTVGVDAHIDLLEKIIRTDYQDKDKERMRYYLRRLLEKTKKYQYNIPIPKFYMKETIK